MDLKLYDHKLELIDEYFRKTNENSLKHIIQIENDRFVVASNFDLESYCVFIAKTSVSNFDAFNIPEQDKFEKKIKLKEVNKQKNAHTDTILSLSKISEISFASGSSEGLLIIWNSDDFSKLIILKPLSEFQSEVKLSLTSASCIKPLSEVSLFHAVYVLSFLCEWNIYEFNFSHLSKIFFKHKSTKNL